MSDNLSFGGAIAAAVDPLNEGDVAYRPEGVAIAVLAMPEMRAIKMALEDVRDASIPPQSVWRSTWYTLPVSVRQWVES